MEYDFLKQFMITVDAVTAKGDDFYVVVLPTKDQRKANGILYPSLSEDVTIDNPELYESVSSDEEKKLIRDAINQLNNYL